MRMFVGVDWASAEHAVCVLDEQGVVRVQLTAVHSATGLAALLRQLRRFGVPATLPIAIERPTASSWTCWWPRGFQSTRSTPTR